MPTSWVSKQCAFCRKLYQSTNSSRLWPFKDQAGIKNKGIDPDLIQSVLHQEKDNWVNYALRAWEKKFKRQDDFSYSEIQKQQRFLLYRGFDRDVISKVFKEVKSSYLI